MRHEKPINLFYAEAQRRKENHFLFIKQILKALRLCALSEQSERALKAEAGDWGLEAVKRD